MRIEHDGNLEQTDEAVSISAKNVRSGIRF